MPLLIQMDSFSMFSDVAPGAESASSSLIPLLAVTEALGRNTEEYNQLKQAALLRKKHVLISLLNGVAQCLVQGTRLWPVSLIFRNRWIILGRAVLFMLWGTIRFPSQKIPPWNSPSWWSWITSHFSWNLISWLWLKMELSSPMWSPKSILTEKIWKYVLWSWIHGVVIADPPWSFV